MFVITCTSKSLKRFVLVRGRMSSMITKLTLFRDFGNCYVSLDNE